MFGEVYAEDRDPQTVALMAAIQRPIEVAALEVSRTLGREEIEEHLDDLIRRNGAEAANRLRDEARRIAPFLGREVLSSARPELVLDAALRGGRGPQGPAIQLAGA